MNELTTSKLQGVLYSQKAQFVRQAFYLSHKSSCHRSIRSIIVLQNSDGSLSVQNPFDGACYDVTDSDSGYEFTCVGFDPMG